ncbi:MAG: hypothetical protein EHM64_04050 [Ignavibacteriae bacterium]|nr:MAG: hypothetical protein EHM64_04050 [Ignavibacteriota bacterium]
MADAAARRLIRRTPCPYRSLQILGAAPKNCLYRFILSDETAKAPPVRRALREQPVACMEAPVTMISLLSDS